MSAGGQRRLGQRLLRSPGDAGRATAFLVLGGNSFGLLAPIVTGYVVAATGSFNAAFAVAGGLALVGAGRLWRWCAARSASTSGRLVQSTSRQLRFAAMHNGSRPNRRSHDPQRLPIISYARGNPLTAQLAVMLLAHSPTLWLGQRCQRETRCNH